MDTFFAGFLRILGGMGFQRDFGFAAGTVNDAVRI